MAEAANALTINATGHSLLMNNVRQADAKLEIIYH
jgi:hypothetical protein